MSNFLSVMWERKKKKTENKKKFLKKKKWKLCELSKVIK